MIKLVKSQTLKRKIRQDDPDELAIPTWDLVAKAIKDGNTKEALEFLEYARQESDRNTASLAAFTAGVVAQLANFGEELVEKNFRERYYQGVVEMVNANPSVEEILQRCVEAERSHHANITVTEEADRYVAKYDPCGTGGRLRRIKELAVTKKAYPWSWSKAGIPYYCAHCCIRWEQIPIELRGYPLRINLCGARPEDPCIQLFYKKPEAIPEEYFTRIGKKKTIK
jgi:hypothetical protein